MEKTELANDVYLCFAASKTVTRPTFAELAPGLRAINPTQRLANSGNPNLRANEATNFDLGLEWYFANASAAYAGVFVKDIEDFIGVSTALNTERFGVPFNSLSQPLNQGNANISGIEIGYQHTFDTGVGYLLNATFTDSSAEFVSGENAGETIPFEGVSDFSYNATLFYENDAGFNARLAWSWRDEFVLLSSDVFGNTLITDAYGQLDASASYAINENFTVFANAINLTDEATKIFSDTTLQPVSFSTVGTRFEIGLKANFY